jgi:NADPH-dependent F420 reductase
MASITLIGSGNMARGIGSRAVAAGYDIQVLDRDPAKADSLARDLAGAGSGSLADAPTGDIVVLALPYTAVQEVLGQLGSQLDGRTVVDITNPVDFETFAGLVVPQDSSAAQEIAKLLPNAQIVKAFNTTFATTLADGSVSDQPLDVLIAGDDQGAKDAVATFVEAAGMRPLDVGPLTQAHWLEGVGFLHMGLQVTKGWGWNTGVKIIGA